MGQTEILLIQTAPEGFPKEVILPGYFLQCLNTTEIIWGIRIALAVIAMIMICVWIYREKHHTEEDM